MNTEVAVKAGVDPRDFIGISIGIGLAVIARLAYRYVIKPGIRWIKRKKVTPKEKIVNIKENELAVFKDW